MNAASSIKEPNDFRALEQARLQALVERNMPLAWQLHAAEFQLITPRGYVYSREQYLEEIEAGQLDYVSWTPHTIEVRQQAAITLLRYRADLSVDSGEGQTSTFQAWHTDSYELLDGLWQVVWSQATAIK